ncbi:MAG: DUF2244 domain-containing protein [Alphaproteobacteria bacterium]|jgi:uncharacterized membrane protein|nr:DUF2244 domain-containing protein [Alphaproteobacteria bacterium]
METSRNPDAQPADQGQPLLFDAVLRPHRSLSGSGFLVLMAVIGVVSFAAGMVFLLMGAWPVFGFFGLDVALIYFAFRLNYRDARRSERLRLRRDSLEVQRVGPGGHISRWRFQPYWLHVDLENAAEHHSRLTLSSHGRSVSIGDFLAPEERASLCEALRAALGRCRCLPEPIPE